MPHVKSVALPNGIRIPYVERGDRDGLPLILLHGYTDSWRSFQPVLPLLPRSLRAFALTQRGHGDADRPESGYALEDFAGDVAAFMDAIGVGAAVIAGHSMGSAVAQRFAIDHPERTLGLVLMGSFATLKGNAGIEAFWASDVAQLADPIERAFAHAFQVSTIVRPVPEAFLQVVVEESLKVPARVWRDALRTQLTIDMADERRRISAPTMILWGDRDVIGSAEQQGVLVAAIKDARLVVYPSVGHALHWEDPHRCAVDLAHFCRQISRRDPERHRASAHPAAATL